MQNNNVIPEIRHSDEIQDIISATPSPFIRWGNIVFFAVLFLIGMLSYWVKYPDIIEAKLKIYALNSPKPIVTKIPARLTQLMTRERQFVKKGQPLAFLESTADHWTVINLYDRLVSIRQLVIQGMPILDSVVTYKNTASLGELQSSYQIFSDELLNYQASSRGGYLQKKRRFLESDVKNIINAKSKLNEQKNISLTDYGLAEQEFAMHKKLRDERVETEAEYRQAESRFLAKKTPIVQTESALNLADGNNNEKEKEISDVDNEIQQGKIKFLRALDSFLSVVADWKSKYILSATQDGQIVFSGVIQQNQELLMGQEVCYIDPKDGQFFGELDVPQGSSGKVKEGQVVLVKLKSYPFEEYGMLHGRITYIPTVAYKDSIFISKVQLDTHAKSDMKHSVFLKSGMTADAEIITQDATVLQRIIRNMMSLLNKR